MQTVLPAKLRRFCRSYECVCSTSHVLYSYLLGITLIIHVASYLPVTGCDSLLAVFSAALHVSVSALSSRCMGKHLCVWCTCGICRCFVLRCVYKVHAVNAPRRECQRLSAALISSYKHQMVTAVLIKLSMPLQEDGPDQVGCLLP